MSIEERLFELSRLENAFHRARAQNAPRAFCDDLRRNIAEARDAIVEELPLDMPWWNVFFQLGVRCVEAQEPDKDLEDFEC